MSEEKTATIDEILETDNLDSEPVEVEKEEATKAEPEETKTDNSKESEPEKEEATAKPTNDELIKKSFGDEVEPEKIEKFLRKMIGEVDINDLSERELKILKSNYHAERIANEKAQKLSELEKNQETEKVKTAEKEIEQLDTQLHQDYQRAKQVIQNSESNDKAVLRKCFEEGTPLKWYDGKEYPVTEETYEFFKDEIVRKHTELSKDLDIEVGQKQAENKQKKSEQYKIKSEQFFNEFSSKPEIVEKIEKTPELKEVIDFLKGNAQPDEEFSKQVIDKFETLIDNAVKRIASKEKINSDIEKDKGKATKLASGVSQAKSTGKIQTLDDILSASLDEL